MIYLVAHTLHALSIFLGNIGLRDRLLHIRSRVNGKGSMIGFDKAMNDRSSYFQLCCM